MAGDQASNARDTPLYRWLHPRTVGDVVVIRHSMPGRLRLALRRSDEACLQAVSAALATAGGVLERGPRGARSLLVRYGAPETREPRLLDAPLPPLPLPPARLSAAADIAAPAAAVWAALRAEEGPPWCPPAMLHVTPLNDPPNAWQIDVRVGPWTLPHQMAVTAEEAPRLLELSIAGKLTGLVRYEITAVEPHQSRLSQQLWFAIDGNAAEVAMGEGIVQQFARRFADEQLRDIAHRVTGAQRPPVGAVRPTPEGTGATDGASQSQTADGRPRRGPGPGARTQ